jgi:hypothetical protein
LLAKAQQENDAITNTELDLHTTDQSYFLTFRFSIEDGTLSIHMTCGTESISDSEIETHQRVKNDRRLRYFSKRDTSERFEIQHAMSPEPQDYDNVVYDTEHNVPGRVFCIPMCARATRDFPALLWHCFDTHV